MAMAERIGSLVGMAALAGMLAFSSGACAQTDNGAGRERGADTGQRHPAHRIPETRSVAPIERTQCAA
jgi:hypothetical protein